jgi:hypothetical protein
VAQSLPQIIACTLEQYAIILGEVVQMDKSTWLNGAQKGEAGQFAAWLCV